MAVSNATLLAKISALEARVTKLAAQVKADESKLNPLLTSNNLTFLAGLRKLGNQNNSLPQDANTGPDWGTGERDLVNESIVSLNTLHSHLQDNGFEDS